MKKIALGFMLVASMATLAFATDKDKGKKCCKAKKECTAEQKAQCEKDGKKCCSKDASASAEGGKKCCAKKAE